MVVVVVVVLNSQVSRNRLCDGTPDCLQEEDESPEWCGGFPGGVNEDTPKLCPEAVRQQERHMTQRMECGVFVA